MADFQKSKPNAKKKREGRCTEIPAKREDSGSTETHSVLLNRESDHLNSYLSTSIKSSDDLGQDPMKLLWALVCSSVTSRIILTSIIC